MTGGGPTIRALGPLAVVVDVEPGTAGRWSATLRALDLPPGAEVVAGAESVTIRVERHDDTPVVCARVEEALVGSAASVADVGRLVEIPVVYDGEDLVAVAAAIGGSVTDVVDRHAAAEYQVDFMGFAPGFGYLTGLDPLLELPRRATPRPVVPAGAVAIAAHYSAVYPSPSPGGWHLIGHTTATMWDVERPEPSLLRPGDRVRFVRA